MPGNILQIGGSNLGWWRLNHGLTGRPPSGGLGNCREAYGIVRTYHNAGARDNMLRILDEMAANGQCWIRLIFVTGIISTGTLVNISNGLVGQERQNYIQFLSDCNARGFNFNLSFFPIADISPFNWNQWEQARYNLILDTCIDAYQLLLNEGFNDWMIDLSNEGAAASNQSDVLKRFGWQIYRDFIDTMGAIHIPRTCGVSISTGAGNPGMSRYEILWDAYNDAARGKHGPAGYVCIHGYGVLAQQSGTNWIKEYENRMQARGDTRNLTLDETHYSGFNGASHVSGIIQNISELTSRDVTRVMQWPWSTDTLCTDVDVADPVEYSYFDSNSAGCRTGLSCNQSSWL